MESAKLTVLGVSPDNERLTTRRRDARATFQKANKRSEFGLNLKERKLSFIESCTGKKFTVNITMSIHPQIFEKSGIKEFAVLPYQEFLEIQQILEDFEDLQDLREAKAEEVNAPTRSLSQVLAEFTKS